MANYAAILKELLKNESYLFRLRILRVALGISSFFFTIVVFLVWFKVLDTKIPVYVGVFWFSLYMFVDLILKYKIKRIELLNEEIEGNRL